MPRGDGSGPNGFGPMTGRAAGLCAGYPVPGFANPVFGHGGFGRGFGWSGRGRGRGYRHMYWAAGLPGRSMYGEGGYYPGTPYASKIFTAEQEAEALRNQAKYMQDNLDALNNRIQELEKLEAERGKP